MKNINIKGIRQNNLKNIDVKIPRGSITVLTGVSGSGKSTLAFDTIFAEGQRKYLESLSNYARQFIDKFEKPDLDSISGLSPTISVDQKTFMRNPRSTIATITEVYDFLRLLFARVGEIRCCGTSIDSAPIDSILSFINKEFKNKNLQIYYPIALGKKGEFKKEISDASKLFSKIRIDGKIISLNKEINLEKQKKHTIEVYVDSLKVEKKNINRISESIDTSLTYGLGVVILESAKIRKIFNKNLSCTKCDKTFPEISPRFFSFNSPFGQCKECEGMGYFTKFDSELIIPDKSKSIKEGALAPFKNSTFYKKIINNFLKSSSIKNDVPFEELTLKNQNKILFGDSVSFEGVIDILEKWYESSRTDEIKDNLSKYRTMERCSSCGGQRLREEALSVLIGGHNISEICNFTVEECKKFFLSISFKGTSELIWKKIKDEILSRLEFLSSVSLGYLSLDRTAPTLSGGEAQRIRLASQLGANLTGVTYVLDEPTIGLHPRDNRMLLQSLKLLKDRGNTVVVVEHDEETIKCADFIIDIGPGAGTNGGTVVATGSPDSIAKNKSSLTGLYLSKKKKINVVECEAPIQNYLSISGAKLNNLKNINVKLPVGKITSVTGVSGSGKSSLVVHTIYDSLSSLINLKNKSLPNHIDNIDGHQHFDKIININQSPIGRTPRSNPSTYTGIFSTIREIFASLPESRMKGFSPGRFSFNVKEGSCFECSGAGNIKIEMSFLPDVNVQCESCEGKRFDLETLSILYRGKNITDVLNMTFSEASNFFSGFPILQNKIDLINSVGLGYLKLGQDATTLSGGEAQRIKLSKELIKKNTGKTLYILDEPTIGLHYEDIDKLLGVIYKLRESGSTVVIIEHNLEIINASDYIIDLGPDGGSAGGFLTFQGLKKDFVLSKNSQTSKFLNTHINDLKG